MTPVPGRVPCLVRLELEVIRASEPALGRLGLEVIREFSSVTCCTSALPVGVVTPAKSMALVTGRSPGLNDGKSEGKSGGKKEGMKWCEG